MERKVTKGPRYWGPSLDPRYTYSSPPSATITPHVFGQKTGPLGGLISYFRKGGCRRNTEECITSVQTMPMSSARGGGGEFICPAMYPQQKHRGKHSDPSKGNPRSGPKKKIHKE